MAELTEEAKKIIAVAGPALVATSSRNGKSHVQLRASFRIIDDETLVFFDIDAPRAINNVRENPQLSALVFDPEHAKSCRIWGKTSILNPGDEVFESVAARLDRELREKKRRLLIQVKVGEVEVY
jgi:hypothetical protein